MWVSRPCAVLAICSTLKPAEFTFLQRILPRGSLARHLTFRLLPPVMVLVAIDLTVTWIITSRINLAVWVLRDIFWMMLAGQIVLVALIASVLISGVRSGLRSFNELSDEIRERSIDDLKPLRVDGVPAEIVPMVEHINDLLVRLNGSMQAQKRFIGSAAHQLRTPLSGLKLECELMLAGNLPPDVHQRAERIKAVTDRMIRLGQQLLVLARADATLAVQDAFRRINLSEWVRESAGEWVPTARQHKVELNLHAPDAPVWIEGDPLLLEELLGNLMDNAFRYGVGATQITLHVAANPPSLSVEDNGPGIAGPDQVRVFDAFYRAADAKTDGSGLGLAIVRQIATAHGAWWGLASRPEFAGTRISIVFPGPRRGARLSRHD